MSPPGGGRTSSAHQKQVGGGVLGEATCGVRTQCSGSAGDQDGSGGFPATDRADPAQRCPGEAAGEYSLSTDRELVVSSGVCSRQDRGQCLGGARGVLGGQIDESAPTVGVF